MTEQTNQTEEVVYTEEEIAFHNRIKENIDEVANALRNGEKFAIAATLHGLNKEEFEQYRGIYDKPEHFQSLVTSTMNVHMHNTLMNYYETTGQPVPEVLDWKNIMAANENPEAALAMLKQFGITSVVEHLHTYRTNEVLTQYSMKYRFGAFVTTSDGTFTTSDIETYIIGAMSILLLNQLPRENYSVDRAIRTIAATLAIESYEALEAAREEFIGTINKGEELDSAPVANDEDAADAEVAEKE